MKHLPAPLRAFFLQIAHSAFENPFSDSRLLSDASALGLPTPLPANTLLHQLLDKLNTELQTLTHSQGKIRLQDYASDDLHPLSIALLFHLFHRTLPAFDRHIHAQEAAPNDPLAFPEGDTLYADLLSYGFSPSEAASNIAIFFQFRRAFHLIDTRLQGQSPSMKALRIQLWNAIFTCNTTLYLDHLWNRMEDFSTLLLGETGTGKGAAAAALGHSGFIPYLPAQHTFAESFPRSFLPINLSEFSESLIESELFGHRRGAFTGAISDYEGLFSRCSPHGAIFLDEIGDVTPPLQIKLLRILQQRLFSPVGGHDALRFSGRVIAATHRDLAALRADGRFRNDFYYRLSSSHITLPTLRQRLLETPSELPTLLSGIVHRLLGTPSPEITAHIEETLLLDLPPAYPWPGNVRELEQATRSILLTGHYTPEALPTSTDPLLDRLLQGSLTLAEASAWYCHRLVQQLGSYEAAATRLAVDWRTVKQKLAALPRNP